MIWILSLLGLVLADKLDRTYLPPPGFKLSGGSPGAIQVPLEHPKLQYTSGNDEYLANPEIAIGINRVAPNRPAGTFSPINNPLINSKNNFPSSTTIIPYPQNKNVSSINEYSTSRPIEYITKYIDDLKNPGRFEYFNREQIQYQQPSISIANQFQTTENYPQLIQNNLISDISNDYHGESYSNQSKPDGELDSIINTFSKSTPLLQLGTDSKNNQFGSGEHSSIPTTQVYSNVISSTFSPTTVNYDYSTTIGPNQFYSSTSKPPQFSTTKPIDYKYTPVLNYAVVKLRPERIQAQADREASILNYESSITPDGYSYTYDTSNGIHVDETGVTVNGVQAKGSYSYIGDDGKLYNVVYTADEHGFQPRGDHLPTSPPIPEAILKVIEQVTKEKEAGITDDGSYDENKYGYRRYHNGYYTPKSNFPKQHSVAVDKPNKNINNIISNYNGAISNQIPNKTEIVPNAYQNVLRSESTTSQPVTKKYSSTNMYIENIDSPYIQQPYFVHNESVIKDVRPYKGLTNRDDANNGLTKQQDVHKQVNSIPIVENGSKYLVGAQLPINKGVVDYNSFIEKNYNQNKPYEYNKETSSAETGYQYNTPHYKENDEFPSRFFDTYNVRNKTLKQDESNGATPKPFQTPYVSRTDEESQEYDNYEKTYEDSEEYHDQESDNNYKYPLDSGREFNANVADNKTDIVGIKHDNKPIHKTYNNHLQTFNEAYPHQQRIFGKHPSNEMVADPQLYSTSTAVPTEFTSRITMLKPQEPKFNIEDTESDQKSTKYIPINVYQTNLLFDKTSKLPDFSTIRPGFTNENPVNVPTGISSVYPQTGLKETNQNIDPATVIPSIENSYAPNLDINHSDERNAKSTTEKIIGEDFTGPKQPQRFDPLTGYHY